MFGSEASTPGFVSCLFHHLSLQQFLNLWSSQATDFFAEYSDVGLKGFITLGFLGFILKYGSPQSATIEIMVGVYYFTLFL